MSIKLTKQSLPATVESEENSLVRNKDRERGSSLVLALLVMFLLLGFVALSLSRTVSETTIASNDYSESKTFEAAQAGLEDATRDFASILETKLNPNTADLTTIKNSPVNGFTGTYNYTKTLDQIGTSKLYTIPLGEFQGLYSLQDEWKIDVKAKEVNSDVEVELNRSFYNNRIPLFQFGAFYNDDLELNRPPLFTFGGKVHTNSNLFITGFSTAGIYFKSKVTVAGEIVNDVWKTGTSLSSSDNVGKVFFPNAAGTDTELATGKASVICTTSTGGPTVLTSSGGQGRRFPYPNCAKNAGWATYSARFEGNLKANTPQLRLPVDRLVNEDGTKVDLIEMMRRGKNVGDKAWNGSAITNVTADTEDDSVLSKERYANKKGIRISLADTKDELPQCVNVATCGVQLVDGFQPKDMTDSATYKTTKVNGARLSPTWIKVELVDFDPATSKPVTTDITQDFLSLGVTEPFYDDYLPTSAPYDNFSTYTPKNPSTASTLRLAGYTATQDSRSIIKIQHFWIDHPSGYPAYPTSYISNKSNFDFVGRNSYTPTTGNTTVQGNCRTGLKNGDLTLIIGNCQLQTPNKIPAVITGDSNTSDLATTAEDSHFKLLTFPKDSTPTIGYQIVPFPIQMYDSREGNRRDSNKLQNGTALPANTLYRGGVMSLVDIDVANLRKFFNGDFNDKLPTTTDFATARGRSLKDTDVKDDRGWVVYFSDRRGDADFDGRYKMEDVNPNGSLIDEDLNNNAAIDVDNFYTEAPRVDKTVDNSIATVTDHTYYRRGVRLINGLVLPGKYDSATPANTKGFTFASENGVYVSGNYNVKSVDLPGGNVPADASDYYPQNDQYHIPASVVGDSVTQLSNNWNDANSFVNAFDTTQRLATDTQVRFAMISGDSLTNRTALSGGDFDGLNGGIHNFMRFLERWNNQRLNYTGSLINLYNSYNNNGRWKCCTTVYDPPIRDWTFDTSFNDPNRLPPGSPFVYYLTLTGFQRVNE